MIPEKKPGEKFTYEDYLVWNDDQRRELLDGEAVNMSPAPSREHQEICGEIYRQISNYLKGKLCKVYSAPFDVRLPTKDSEKIINVVQPDISIICDMSKLDEKGCLGSPDLIVEVLSPHTSRKDRLDKFRLYEKAGVGEYWIVRPQDKLIEVFLIGENKKYIFGEIYTEKDIIECSVVEGLKVTIKDVFEE